MSLAGRSSSAAQASKRVDSAMERGQFGEAETLLRSLVVDYENQPSAKPRYAKALYMLASAQWRQQKQSEAQQNAEKARNVFSELKQFPEIAECLELLGSIAIHDNDATVAAERFSAALEALEKARRHDTPACANLKRRYSEALRKKGEFKLAKEAANEAVRIIEGQSGKTDVHVAEYLIEVARSEAALGDLDAAINILDRTLETYRNAIGPNSDEVVGVLRVLANVSQDCGDLERAVGYYEQALQVRERQLGQKGDDFGPLLVELGTVHSLLGRFGPAIETLQQAVMRLERDRDANLAVALDTLGSTYYQFGRFEDAVQCARRARQIWTTAPANYQQQLLANDELLRDVAEYLSEQQRSALGLDPSSLPPPGPATAVRKRPRAPWETPDGPQPERTKAPEQQVKQDSAPVPAPPSPPSFDPGLGMPIPAGFGGHESGMPYLAFAPSAMPAPNQAPDTAMRSHPVSSPLFGFSPGLPAGSGAQIMPGGTLGHEFAFPVLPSVPQSFSAAPPLPAGNVQPAAHGGVTVQLVQPDGTPVTGHPGDNQPLHLTVVLGETGAQRRHTTAVAHETAPPVLNGWEDLEFEFMALSSANG